MRIPFRIKLFLASMALVMASLASADHFLSAHVRSFTMASERDELAGRLELTRRGLPPAAGLTPAQLDEVAKDAGGAAATAWLLAGDDSPRVRSSHAQNPTAGAPEVSEARAHPGAIVTWADPHPLRPLVRAAVALPGDVVLQVARPVPEADQAIVAMQRQLGRGLLLALLLVAAITYGGPKLVSREIDELTETARRMSQGDLSVRVQLDNDDPYAHLGQALDRLAENLTRTVTRLREESDLLGRILEAMEEGVLVLDEDRKVVLLNRAMSSMLLVDPRTAGRPTASQGQARGHGRGAESSTTPSPLDVKGKSLLEITMNPDLEALLDRAVTQPPRSSGEIEVGDLKPRRLLVRAARLSGAPWGFLLVFIDVTEVRRLESLRRDFVANVSHELRTPVAAVRSAAETLRHAVHRDPGAAERFLAIIERNTERLQILVEDLLDLSRIESREYRLAVEPQDVARVVADVLSLFRERADSRRVILRADVRSDLPPLHTDRRALEQVLVNLVDNAVKYIPEEASITVRAEPHGDTIRFLVTDTGAGIAAHHLPRLFERFYRVDPGRSRDRGGSGLGLAIVKHLCEAMGGVVAVDSALGKGTTFRVDLPAKRVLPPPPVPDLAKDLASALAAPPVSRAAGDLLSRGS